MEHVRDELDTGKIVVMVLVDLHDLDTVNIGLLLDKLSRIGGVPYRLIQTYLAGPMLYTTVDGHHSRQAIAMIGVPQGSVLGPNYYLLFIQLLPTTCKTVG